VKKESICTCGCRTYVVLVREGEKTAWNATALQHVEHGQALSDRQTIIEFVVDDLVMCQKVSLMAG
jgi:hypothetical protein